jgi:transketolase
MRKGELPEDLLEQLVAAVDGKEGATRKLSGQVIQRAVELVPWLIGGSADLAPSNKTLVEGADDVAAGTMGGQNLHFGIREHAMASLANGMILHGPFRPYVATFLVFADYLRPALRLAALMEQPIIYVFTHDSFFVGEDGPTHQPVEHLWSLRVIPNLVVFRPADGLEVAAAWTSALESEDRPHALALSRQGVPLIDRPDGFDPRTVLRGAYVLVEAEGGEEDLTIVATGSEVSLALEARAALGAEGLKARVVSMPSVELFLEQDEAYQASILPPGKPRVALEAGVTAPWRSVVGRRALVIGLDTFGASAPAGVLKEKLGFTAEQVGARIADWLRSRG